MRSVGNRLVQNQINKLSIVSVQNQTLARLSGTGSITIKVALTGCPFSVLFSYISTLFVSIAKGPSIKRQASINSNLCNKHILQLHFITVALDRFDSIELHFIPFHCIRCVHGMNDETRQTSPSQQTYYYIRKTPYWVLLGSQPTRLATAKEQPSTILVSAGSMIPSSHNRAVE